jgi:hypothetical protein
MRWLPTSPALLALLALLALSAPRPAHGWSAGQLGKSNAERARLTCALIQRFGPNRADSKLKLVIPSSPFGPLRVTMKVKMKLHVNVSFKRFSKAPGEAERAKIQAWLRAQLPAKPRACKLLLGRAGFLQRLQYPGEPLSHLSGREYVESQLRLHQRARARKEPDAWRWADGAVAAYLELPKEQRRALKAKRAAIRAAAYRVVKRSPPPGLNALGRRGYCQWYRKLRRQLQPRTAAERRALRRARRKTRCR